MLTLLLSLVLGYFIASRFLSSRLDRAIAATPVGILATTLIAIPLHLVSAVNYLGLVLIILLIILVKVLKLSRSQSPSFLRDRRGMSALAIVAAPSLYYSWTRIVSDAGGMFTGGVFGWSDLSLHLTLINHFAHDTSFDLSNPLIVGRSLNYPFLSDYYTSLLVRDGMDIVTALNIQNVLLSIALIYFGAKMITKLFGSRAVGIAAVGLLLYGGNIYTGGQLLFDYFTLDQAALDRAEEVLHFKDYNNDFFINFFNSHMLSQRALLLGYPLLFIMMSSLQSVAGRVGKRKTSFVVILGLILGFMPLVHVHSYVLAALFTLVTAGYYLATDRKQSFKVVFSIGLIGLLVSVGLAFFILVQSGGASVRFAGSLAEFDYNYNVEEGVLRYIFKQHLLVVLALLLSVVAVLKVRPNKNDILRHSYFWLVGLLAYLFIFQSNSWDNNKLSSVFHFYVFGVFSWLLLKQRNWLLQIGSGLAISLALVAGVATLYYDHGATLQVKSIDDQALGERSRQIIPNDSLVFTTRNHNNPVISIGGYDSYISEAFWLSTYGFDTKTEEEIHRTISADINGSIDIVRSESIDWIVLPADRLNNGNIGIASVNTALYGVTEANGWVFLEVL